MIKRFTFLLLLLTTLAKSQCPQVFNYLGVPSSNPYWISCSGGPYTLNFSAPTSWGTYTINWGDGTPNFNSASYTASTTIAHTYTATVDTFPVTLTIPGLTCTLTGVVVMEKPVNSIVQIALGGTNTTCAPGTLTFQNVSTNVSKTTSFTWNFGDGSPPSIFSYTNSGMNVSHTYAPGAVNCQTFVTLQAKNYCSMGVPTRDSASIQVFGKDIASIGFSSLIKCWPDNVFTFTNTTTKNCSAYNTFQRKEQWNLGNFFGFGVDSIIPWKNWPPITPVLVAYPSVGTYSVVIQDSSFCGVSSSTLNVIIVNPPVSGIAVPGGTLCKNTPITFTNTTGTGFFYQWNFGAGGGWLALPFGPAAYTYTAAGTYTVQLASFIPGGGTACKDTAKVVITIAPTPTANFSFSPNSGCGTLAGVTFTDSSIGATTWNWTFGNGNTSAVQTPAAQNYTTFGVYTVSLTAGNGSCSDTKTATVNVYQKPIAAFSPTAICIGSVTSFTDQSVASLADPIVTWNWSFGDGSPNSSLQNPTHTYTALATYTVKLVVNTANCSDSTQIVVATSTMTPFSFTFSPSSGCTPLGVSFTPGPGVVNANWSFGDGNNSNVLNPSHTYTNATLVNQNYTVTMVATNVNGCIGKAYGYPVVFPKPISNFSLNPTGPACSPLIVSFTNMSVINATSNWDFGDGILSTQTNPIHTFTTNASFVNTTYSVSLIVFSANGCRDTMVKTVSLLPHPKSFFGVDTPACSSKVLTFTNTSVGATSYSWDFGNGNTSTSTNTTLTQQYINNSGVNQTYTVQLITTNANSCTDILNVPITIHSKLNVNIVASKDSGCAALRVNFPPIAGVNNYSWNFGDGNSGMGANITHTFINNGNSNVTYSVQLIATDGYGCADTVSKKIKVFPKPKAMFSVNPTNVVILDQPIVCANTSTNNTTNFWQFGDGGISAAVNPSYTYSVVGNYQVTLIVTNSKGCKDTMILATLINAVDQGALQMPNAFTPNALSSNGGVYSPTDLNNDVFHPVVRGGIDVYEMTIYSRWGEVLFETKDIMIGWDGYYKGKLCTQDVYIWKVKLKTLDGFSIYKTGDLTLLSK